MSHFPADYRDRNVNYMKNYNTQEDYKSHYA